MLTFGADSKAPKEEDKENEEVREKSPNKSKKSSKKNESSIRDVSPPQRDDSKATALKGRSRATG